MSEDEHLRARSPDEAAAADGEPRRGPRALAPTRPWERQPSSAQGAQPEPARPSEPAASPERGPSALGPVRPWLARESARGAPEAPASPPPPNGRNGQLRPARPWADRPAAAKTEQPPSTAPAPSNPDIVLRRLAESPLEQAEPAAEPVAEPVAAEPAAEVPARPAADATPLSKAPARRPIPGNRSGQVPARPRPRPGPNSTGGASGKRPGRQVDLTRFLEASRDEPDDDADKASARSARWRRALTRTVIVVAIAAVAAFLLRMFVVQPYYIPSASMEPTLHGCPGCNDDHVLVDKISYRAHDAREGDIIVFHRPSRWHVSETVLIKRVIGLPGDKISMKRGRVYINGLLLDEPYLNKHTSCYATSPDENFGPRTVPAGDVYVMGDNRCDSSDSRANGPVPESSIIGRAFAIIWPLNRIGSL